MTDIGTGYGRPRPTFMRELTLVGPGSPMGELLRRYWHPVGLVGDAGLTPKALRVLGEDLVLFRDRRGRPGLVTARCAHRGTTLHYGRVEERGIRCCYHGWLFDVEGRCLEQPCEPDGGTQRERMRQPWYPVQERYGLIHAYMGPPARKPVLPRYEVLETLEPGEFLEADDSSVGGGGPAVIPCNWLQHYENLMDTLRSRLNGKLWEELTVDEHRDFPGDYEAQVGQGPITLHSEEHLVSSDRGVALVRSQLKAQLDALAEGRDPIAVTFDPAAPA